MFKLKKKMTSNFERVRQKYFICSDEEKIKHSDQNFFFKPSLESISYLPQSFFDRGLKKKHSHYDKLKKVLPIFNIQRGLLDGLLGLFIGGNSTPGSTTNNISYTTSVSNQTQFENYIQNVNQTIATQMTSYCSQTLTSAAELANFQIIDLSGNNITLSLNNTQAITIINTSNLNIQQTNQFIIQQASSLVNDVLNSFQNASLTNLASVANNSTQSNLIQSLLNTNPSNGNVSNAIANDTNVAAAFSNEQQQIQTNIAQNSNISNFAQNFQSNFNQSVNFNIQNVSATGNVVVALANEQSINALLNVVTKLDLATNVYNTISESNTFKMDSSVTNATQAIASGQSTSTGSAETVGSAVGAAGSAVSGVIGSAGTAASGVIGSAGTAASGVIGSAGSAASGVVGSAISSFTLPFIILGGGFLILVAIFFLRPKK